MPKYQIWLKLLPSSASGWSDCIVERLFCQVQCQISLYARSFANYFVEDSTGVRMMYLPTPRALRFSTSDGFYEIPVPALIFSALGIQTTLFGPRRFCCVTTSISRPIWAWKQYTHPRNTWFVEIILCWKLCPFRKYYGLHLLVVLWCTGYCSVEEEILVTQKYSEPIEFDGLALKYFAFCSDAIEILQEHRWYLIRGSTSHHGV